MSIISCNFHSNVPFTIGPRQKQDLLSCCPDVITYIPQSKDDFIVIASDGLWDVLTSDEVVDRVRNFLKESGIYSRLSEEQKRLSSSEAQSIKEQIKEFAFQLARYATKSLQSRDNITVMILLFQKSSPYTLVGRPVVDERNVIASESLNEDELEEVSARLEEVEVKVVDSGTNENEDIRVEESLMAPVTEEGEVM